MLVKDRSNGAQVGHAEVRKAGIIEKNPVLVADILAFRLNNERVMAKEDKMEIASKKNKFNGVHKSSLT
ncbi:MAG TPA: hypothetical protein VI977_02270 [archaeon]|nr:hypothetical protein [archaeon]